MGEDQDQKVKSTSNLLPEPIANGYPAMDPEAESARKAEEMRRQKRKKRVIFFAVFTVFQIAMLLVTVLVVMKFRTPQFRVKSGTFNVINSDAGTNPSFNITIFPNLRIKNTNFGTYKYGETTVQFFYRGSPVGSVVVHKSKVGMRSTKRVGREAVELRSAGIAAGNLVTELGNDLRSGMLTLTSEARLNGRVEMMFIIKKKKAANMNCSMQLNISTGNLDQIICH